MSTTAPATQTLELLKRARQQGQADVYSGKRHWVRYNLGMVVQISVDPTQPSDGWDATLHDISGGGLGLWSNQPLEPGSTVHIRDCVEGDKPVWIAGQVTHCTLGLRGHLIGIAFLDPLQDHAESDASATLEVERETNQDKASSRRGHRDPPPESLPSLRSKCTLAGAVACGIALLGEYAFHDTLADSLGQYLASAVGVIAGLVIGSLCGWLIIRQEIHFIAALQTALRNIAAGQEAPDPLIGAPSRELASLSRAFHGLNAQWKKRSQDERIQRERLEELARIKTNFLSIVSHDLRTPLTSMVLYGQMLRDELDTLTDDDKRNFVNIICDECNRLSRLVDDLLEVQRLESDRVQFELSAQDITDTIRSCFQVFEPMALSKSMTLTLNCPDELPRVEADTDKMAQVFNNLISNALKYTEAGGKVQVSAESRAGEIIFCVADNGPGIPRDKWDQIFDRFSQLGDPNVCEIAGVGLGLYIVSKIVEAHGGRTWVDSAVGKGSAFFVALPVEGRREEKKDRPDASPHIPRVLVCDSDSDLLATMEQVLRTEGFEVRVTCCGQRLLQLLDSEDIDVLVTDVALPDIGGQELLDALNRLPRREFRTIIHSYEGDAQTFQRRGVDMFLRRPVSKEQLIQSVKIVSRRRNAVEVTVALVQSPHVDCERLTTLLANAGHMAMLAESYDEAAQLARDYGGSVILVMDKSLGGQLDKLADGSLENRPDVIVMTDALRRAERRFDDELQALIVGYRQGEEEEILDAVMDCKMAQSGSHQL